MRTVLKLAFAFLREHPMRLILTALATVASACMVVWVVGGYDALLNSFEEYSDQSLGRYTLSVAPISTFRQYAPGAIPQPAEKFVPPEVVAQLRADPVVAVADPMWAQRLQVHPVVSEEVEGADGREEGRDSRPPSGSVKSNEAPRLPPRIPEVRLLGLDATESPFPLLRGRWIDPNRPDEPDAAIAADIAERLGIDVGDELLAGTGERRTRIRIVGLVKAPVAAGFGAAVAAGQLMSPSVGGMYVPMQLAERLVGQPARISFVGVAIRPGKDVNKFRFGWAPRLGRFSTPVQFQEAHDIEETLDQSASAENVKMQAYAATGISLLAALFIIFSTLNMGVGERVRQFAVLRSVVLTRFQVGLLIMIESLTLATIGFVGGLGAGWSLLRAMAKSSPKLFTAGAVMGPNSILLAAVCAYGGALLSAVIPAYRATRVRPVDAMSPRVSGGAQGISLLAVAVGAMLISVNPLVTFVLPLGDEARYVLYMLVGCVSMGIGFVLLAPATVILVDRLVASPVALMLGLPPKLLASQITSNLWRTVGTSIALTIGLGLYIAIQVWGFTMLGSFVPGSWAPDALISFNPGGLPAEHADAVARFKGVDPDRCLPLVVEQPRLLEDLTRSAERASVVRQDNVVIVGLDPERAFGGEKPLLEFDWAQGSPADAVRRMAEGRACIVPDHFLRETGLKVGDSFELVPPDRHENPVRYTVAGAVRLPGWHWQTKPTGFRSRTHRAAALVFADYPSVAADFDRHTASHVWFDFDASQTDRQQLAREAQALYSRILEREAAVDSAPNDAPYVRVMPIEGIRSIVLSHAKQWIWAMSRLPLITLCVTCIGVLNAILASVRARRWDMGVLRAVGFTRSTLVRLVIAEGLLIGTVACVMSLAFGILAGWCGAGISQYISFFGGLNPELVIPWLRIGYGLAAVLVLSALAAVWPAASVGRTQPLALLQQGRGPF